MNRKIILGACSYRCVWKEANVGSLIRDTGVTGPIIDKLRIMCGKPGPVFRPSLKFVF